MVPLTADLKEWLSAPILYFNGHTFPKFKEAEIAKLRDFVAQGPTEAELQAAKDNLIGGFALRIDANGKLLDNVTNIAWNGLALDYLDTWTQQVEKITIADIRAAFSRKLQPVRMVTVVVGGAP